MTAATRLPVTVIGLFFCLSLAFFILPALGGQVWLSPDETANAATALAFTQSGSFRLSQEAALIADFSWLHPRSFVVQGESLVPVGFLGMSFMLAIVRLISGQLGVILLSPLLALSVIVPLWSFSQRFGKAGQIATVIGWLTFPTVILYANRGLFSNLAVVCLTLWAAWLVWRWKTSAALIVAGALTGLALMMRPTEAVWIFPWLIVAWQTGLSQSLRMTGRLLLPALAVCLFGAWLGYCTYGSWFVSGYQLHDPIPLQLAPGPATNLLQAWPFGFHPRNVWFNVSSYFVIFLWPWFLLSLAAVVLAWKKKAARSWIVLAIWTGFVLSMIYGQAIYQDHIKLNQISLANSFLRYALPVSIIGAFSLGYVVYQLRDRWSRVGEILSVALMVGVGTFGLWTAFARDDEGLLQNRLEIARYMVIRAEAVRQLPLETVVLSDRSDKIFFPVFRAVSPLPDHDRIRLLLERGAPPVALFLRTQTVEQLQAWQQNYLRLMPLFSAGNETLYRAGLVL